MDLKSDLQYIVNTIEGDVNSFSFLVLRYQDFVYTLALRILKNSQDAEEVTQDVFIKAFDSLKNFKRESKFSSWLYSIAYNKAIDKIRSNKRLKETSDIMILDDAETNNVKNALEILEEEERNIIVRKGIDALSVEMSSLFLLYYFEELSIKEIAEITKLTKENIKIKLYRGRKKLFSILQNQLYKETSFING